MYSKLFKRTILMVAMMGALAVRAQNVEFLNITAKGETVSFALADHPVMTYEADKLHFKTADRTLTVDVADITGYGFSSTASAIATAQRQDRIEMHAGHLFFSGLKAADNVRVYAVDGKVMMQAKPADDGRAEVDMSLLPTGVYVVRTNNHAIKIINQKQF